MSEELRFDVLGPLRASRDGVPLKLPGSTVARRLLGVLLLAQEPLPAPVLTRLAWSDRVEPVSRGSLHVGISRLRDWLATETAGAVTVRHEGQGYQLVSSPDLVDARRFRRLVGE